MKIKQVILISICILIIAIIPQSVQAVESSIYGTFNWGSNGAFTVTGAHGTDIIIIHFNSDDITIPQRIYSGDTVGVTYINTLTETTDVDGNTIFVWIKSDICVSRIKGGTSSSKEAVFPSN